MLNDVEEINTILQKRRYYDLKPVLNELATMPYAIIKGEPLSVLAYGRIGNRGSSDIDILIPKDRLNDVEALLIKYGYTTRQCSRIERIIMCAYSHQVAPWRKRLVPFGDTTIDINLDIFWGEYTGRRVSINEFLLNTIEIDIYGCTVKTLQPLQAMVQLILHHYKEMNSIYHLARHNCINYNMFKDVYYLWKNNKEDLAIEKIYSICTEYAIIPYAFYVFYYTNAVFKDEELQKYVDAFRTIEGETYLDNYGLTEKERRPWKVDFQTRLKADNLYELIKNDLTEVDIEKLKRNVRMFG